MKNDLVGYFVVMVMAVLLIIFKGSSDYQASIFNSLLSTYIEETAASITYLESENQLADMSNAFAYAEGIQKIQKPSVFNTIQDNSVIFRSTILTDILEEFSDRGSEVITYTVQEGDSLSFIASDYGVSVNTIIAANNLKSPDQISPGMELKIPPVNGVLHKVKSGDTVELLAKKYSVEGESIISFNYLPLTGELDVGRELIIPGGKLPQTIKPVVETIKRFAYLPNLGSFFSAPTTGYNWGRIHGRNGVDMANSCGTPIYAVADGSVTMVKTSGWNGGFGKYLKIQHSNGTETLYAHISKITTSLGNSVLKGEQVGLMGTTGRSTGCHLHFEVHGAINPLAK